MQPVSGLFFDFRLLLFQLLDDTALLYGAPDGQRVVHGGFLTAVDTETEKVILDNLKETRKGKTTILIAHRISTVKGMDKIIYLEDGAVAAIGTHDELMVSCEEYRKTVELQRLEDEKNKEGGML